MFTLCPWACSPWASGEHIRQTTHTHVTTTKCRCIRLHLIIIVMSLAVLYLAYECICKCSNVAMCMYAYILCANITLFHFLACFLISPYIFGTDSLLCSHPNLIVASADSTVFCTMQGMFVSMFIINIKVYVLLIAGLLYMQEVSYLVDFGCVISVTCTLAWHSHSKHRN